MTLYKAVETLRTYNRWRRGESEFAWKGKPEPFTMSPREIGEAIDTCVSELEDQFTEGTVTLELGKIAYKGKARINPLAVTIHFDLADMSFSLVGIVYNQTHTAILACGDIFEDILYKVDAKEWPAIAKLYRKYGDGFDKRLQEKDVPLVQALVFA